MLHTFYSQRMFLGPLFHSRRRTLGGFLEAVPSLRQSAPVGVRSTLGSRGVSLRCVHCVCRRLCLVASSQLCIQPPRPS